MLIQKRTTTAAALWGTILLASGCVTEGPPQPERVGHHTAATAPGTMVAVGSCNPQNHSGPSDCTQYQLTCGVEALIEVDLRVTPPNPQAPFRGTVLLASGSAGTDWYSNQNLITELTNEGFRTVERRWVDSEFGWLDGQGGLTSVSCRLDTVIDHLKQQYGHQGAICATGSSGGALELELAMFHHSAGKQLAFAMPTGGGIYNLEHGCFPMSYNDWLIECGHIASTDLSCSTTTVDEILCGVPSELSLAWLDDDTCMANTPTNLSLLRPDDFIDGPNLVLPNLQVTFMFGGNDCEGHATNGLKLYHEMETVNPANTSLVVIPGAPHEVHTTATGEAEMVAQFLTHCTQ